jgi:hypothetical protein
MRSRIGVALAVRSASRACSLFISLRTVARAIFEFLELSPQFLHLPGQRLIAVTRKHIAENGSRGAKSDLIVLALLNQPVQLVRRDGPKRRQSPDGGLYQFAAHLMDSVAEGTIGKAAANRGLGTTPLLRRCGDRCPGSEGQH